MSIEDTEKLWESVRGLAAKLANRYTSDSDDLMQEGFLAMLDAVADYDETRGASFSTYCYNCMRARMYRYEINDNTLSIPEGVVAAARRDEKKVAVVVSFDDPVNDDITIGDTLGAEDERIEEIEKAADLDQLEKMYMSILEPDESQAVKAQFFDDLTVRQQAQKFGYSEQKAAGLRAKALKKMRRDKNIKQYYRNYYTCSGLTHFLQTWESSTEHFAMMGS